MRYINEEEIKKIISSSSFEVIPGKFVYVTVSSKPDLGDHFLISQDEKEITVVTKEENLGDLDIIERDKSFWSLIAINNSAPFYSVGFLGTVTGAIGEAGMDNLVISTFSRDYIMVVEENLEKTKVVLINLGFKEI